jgi:hypothetical protein
MPMMAPHFIELRVELEDLLQRILELARQRLFVVRGEQGPVTSMTRGRPPVRARWG